MGIIARRTFSQFQPRTGNEVVTARTGRNESAFPARRYSQRLGFLQVAVDALWKVIARSPPPLLRRPLMAVYFDALDALPIFLRGAVSPEMFFENCADGPKA
jgi:hypothetical protein